MRIHAIRTLILFWKLYPDAELFLRNWYGIIKTRTYTAWDKLVCDFKGSTLIEDSLIGFSFLKRYVLVVKFNYDLQIWLIIFIGYQSDYIKNSTVTYLKKYYLNRIVVLIKTETELKHSLVLIEKLFSAKKKTKEWDILSILSSLVQRYEEIHYKINPLTTWELLCMKS